MGTRDRRRIRVALQCAATVLLVNGALGTSCAEPPVYVFRRYPLASRPDSTLPSTLSVRGYSFSRPPTKRRHWWDNEPPRPTCEGFQLYRLDHLPNGISRDSFATLPPIQFELLLNRSATPALVIYYQYGLPLRTLDPSTPDGAAQAARMAHQEAAMDSAADDVARKLVGSAGIERFTPDDTMRTQSPEARRYRCQNELTQAR
jgi:hypothetical protein